MSTESKPLSPRHARFVAAYLKHGNATRAYIRAGYAPSSADANASRLLSQPHIRAAVAEGSKRVAESLQISVEQIAAEYAKIALTNVDDFLVTDKDGHERVDLGKADRARRAGLVELTITGRGETQQVKIKLGKLQALAMLTRYMDVLVIKPEPGLTPEDRKRLEEHAEAARRGEAYAREQQLKAEEELRTMRRKLAQAEAKLEAQAPEPKVEAPQQQPGPAPVAVRPKGIPMRDTPEFAALLSKLRNGTLDYYTAELMVRAGYGDPEPEEPDMTYQMQCEYDPFRALD